MSNVNQLLAKAMSTTSEEEAMSCLRLARKRSNVLDLNAGLHLNHTAKYWYDKALMLYNDSKLMHSAYSQKSLENNRLRSENTKFQAELSHHKKRNSSSLAAIVSLVAFNFMLILLVMIISS